MQEEQKPSDMARMTFEAGVALGRAHVRLEELEKENRSLTAQNDMLREINSIREFEAKRASDMCEIVTSHLKAMQVAVESAKRCAAVAIKRQHEFSGNVFVKMAKTMHRVHAWMASHEGTGTPFSVSSRVEDCCHLLENVCGLDPKAASALGHSEEEREKQREEKREGEQTKKGDVP